MTLDEQTQRVNDMIEVVRDTPPGIQRRTMSAILLKRAVELHEATKAFAVTLNDHWQACNDQPDHPKAHKREDKVLADLDLYVAACRATHGALMVQGGRYDS